MGPGDVGEFSAGRGDEGYFLSAPQQTRPCGVIYPRPVTSHHSTERYFTDGKLRGKEVKWLA